MTTYVGGVRGKVGEISSPIEYEFGLYSQGSIINPDTYPEPRSFFFNGPLKVTAPEDSSHVLDVAEFTTGIINRPHSDRDYAKLMARVGPGLQYLLAKLLSIQPGNNRALDIALWGMDPETGQEASDEDIEYFTENVVPRDHPIAYFSRGELIIGWDSHMLNMALDETQYRIADALKHTKPPHNDIVPIGFGFLDMSGDKPELVARPNPYFRIGERGLLRTIFTTFEETTKQVQVTQLYTYLHAITIWLFWHGTNLDDFLKALSAANKKYKETNDPESYSDIIGSNENGHLQGGDYPFFTPSKNANNKPCLLYTSPSPRDS